MRGSKTTLELLCLLLFLIFAMNSYNAIVAREHRQAVRCGIAAFLVWHVLILSLPLTEDQIHNQVLELLGEGVLAVSCVLGLACSKSDARKPTEKSAPGGLMESPAAEVVVQDRDLHDPYQKAGEKGG